MTPATVRVAGTRVRSARLNEFETRRKRGFGIFITDADIEHQHTVATVDLMRRVPGMRVVDSIMDGAATASYAFVSCGRLVKRPRDLQATPVPIRT